MLVHLKSSFTIYNYGKQFVNCFGIQRITHSHGLVRSFQSRTLNRTVYEKDIVLFQHADKSKFFALVGLASISQFMFWTYLGNFAFTELRSGTTGASTTKSESSSDNAVEKQKNLASLKVRGSIALLSVTAGTLLLLTGCLYATRNVQQLVLLKQGKGVLFTTYTPWGGLRSFGARIEDVSSRALRPDGASHIPLKVKGRRFFFLLDKNGQFPQPSIFDRTVGIRRF